MLAYRFLGLVGPDYLIVSEDCLALVVEDPLHSSLLHCVDEVFVAVAYDPLHGLDHLLLQVIQPHLDVEPCADSIDQLDRFPFRTDDPLYCGGSLFLYVQSAYSLE